MNLYYMSILNSINLKELYDGILERFEVLKLIASQNNFDNASMDKQERFGVGSSRITIDTYGSGTISLSADETFSDPQIKLTIN